MNDKEKKKTVLVMNNMRGKEEVLREPKGLSPKGLSEVGESGETREINPDREREMSQQEVSDLIVGIDTVEGRDITGATVIRDGKVLYAVRSDELWHGDEVLANLVQSGQLNCDEELMQIFLSPRPPVFPDDIQVRKPHRGQARVLSRKRGKRAVFTKMMTTI